VLRDVALPTGRVTSRWTGAEALTLAASPYPSTAALVADAQRAAVAAITATEDLVGVRDRGTYDALAARVRDRLEGEVHRIAGEVVRILAASRGLDAAIRGTTSPALLGAVADVNAQRAALAGPGFLAATPPERLRHLARYLDAATARLAKAADYPARDTDLARRVRALEEALAAARSAVEAGPADPDRTSRAEDARWLIEELRVSFFAQQLGTAVPVSEKRVAKAIAAI
jgi:ATP-dependent helicase HrpA